MKSLTQLSFAVITPLTCFAASLFMPSAAMAQLNPLATPGDPSYGQSSVYFMTQPGSPTFYPEFVESIGMRQARLQADAGTVGQPIATIMVPPGAAITAPTETEVAAVGGAPAVENVASTQVVQPGITTASNGMSVTLNQQVAKGLPRDCLAVTAVDSALLSDSLDDQQIQSIQTRIQASQNAAEVAQSKAAQFSGDTQSQLRDAVQDMNARRSDLENSLTAARGSATTDAARAHLVAAYGSYADAAARVQSLTNQ